MIGCTATWRQCARMRASPCLHVIRPVVRTNFIKVESSEVNDESDLYWRASPTKRYTANKKTKWNRSYEHRHALQTTPGAEEAAHNRTERVPVDRDYDAEHARWLDHAAHQRKQMLLQGARRFRIFEDLSPFLAKRMGPSFVRNHLHIEYDVDGVKVPIISGTNLAAGMARAPPHVHWHTQIPTKIPEALMKAYVPRVPDAKYTVAMLSLDGNIENVGKEKLHWLATNATEGTLAGSTAVCSYAQPLPFKGTGWHRVVYLLLKQSSDVALEAGCLDTERTSFSLDKFMSTHYLALDGFAFGQAKWDDSVDTAYKTVHGATIPQLNAQTPAPIKVKPPKKQRYHYQAKSRKETGRSF